ncbi:glutathione S-transferase [Cognatiyoonia sp. IB215446]|uniref:glutathione S-transferase n=1 Tax=Cognatiyoonia sp. IB215446 TaxID=3097355 RepID=UPI002A167F9C|nr:glutathione S-transferase [Cognatiyoonia sp. IB215446]MDX8347054.1 glutathione S-transferase [Cognatiyoonia sp. IB215446]
MTYDLYIGDRTFSSWSLRAWLLFEKFNIPFKTHLVGLYAGTYRSELAPMPPARTVPAVRTPEGHVLSDSLAIAETLAERHPDIALYPADPAARALARSITAEMHSSFLALRSDCPNMITHVWDGFMPSDAVRADITRIEALWALAKEHHGQEGPWLFGAYTIADAFYAPVAMRITAYDLPINAASQTYVDNHLKDPAFVAWREASRAETYDPWPYPMELGRKPWPGDMG